LTAPLEPGAIRLRGVSRRFKVVHERNSTLKETIIRRQRARTTDLWALRGVDLDVSPGESVGLVGRNGSGKSTLLKMLAGIIPPHDGTIETGGTVASMLELGAGFHPDFTGRENVFMNGAIHGLSEKTVRDRLPQIIEFSELDEFIDMPVRTYSSGMQMRLAFAVAAHVSPDILLLDEVLAVGDEAFQRKCMGRIHDFRNRGGTLIFVSHNPEVVEQICDRAVLIENGVVIKDGKPSSVITAYHRRLAEQKAPIRTDIEEIFTPTPEAADEMRRDGIPPLTTGWGTGEVVVEAAILFGPEGWTDRLISGDRSRLDIALRAHTTIVNPNITFKITTGDGVNVFGTSTRLAGFDVPELSGPRVIAFTMPALPIHEGHFSVDVAVMSDDGEVVYHWSEGVTEFSVFSRHPGTGITAVEGEWAFVGEPSLAQ
jgi:ABC-type polysaccharide/polyol phosphate transport system ATPase subunit